MNPTGKAKDIEAAAAAWFERREWSNWDAAAEKELETWLCASTAHRVAYVRLVAAWERAERLKALGAGVAAGRVPGRGTFGFPRPAPGVLDEGAGVPDQKEEVVHEGAEEADEGVTSSHGHSALPVAGMERKRWRRRGGMMAASLLAISVVAVLWYQSLGRWHSYGTPVGTVAPVALSDGSRITLDSNTQVQVDLRSDRRLVRLDKGEAVFDVAKDPQRPLVVQVADKLVTVVGTVFSVRRDSNEIQVRVMEGRVRVEDGRGHSGDRATEVEPGAEATTDQGQIRVDRPGLDEIERALSWREGYLVFHETPLPEVVAEFNRYRTQKIEIDDSSINSIRIGGRFRCTDANAFLALLQQGFPVAVTQDGSRIGLHRR